MNEPNFEPPAVASFDTPEMLLGSPTVSAATNSVKKSGRGGRLGVGGLVVALALGGAIAARTALQAPAGPDTSDEAVAEFFAALDADDLVGIAEVIHPAERESIAQPMFDMIEQGRRLEVIAAEGTDAGEVAFVDFEVEGLTYSVERTGPRLHFVTTTGGTVTVPDEIDFPEGPLFDRFDVDLPRSDGSTTTSSLADEPMKLAVVEDDGSWYISIWYSTAENIRRDAGLAFPGVGSGPVPVGAETPDGVMEDMSRALSALDPESVLTLLDPQESAVLYDYSPLYMDDLNSAMTEVRSEAAESGVSWNLDAINFDATEVNGRQVVEMSSMSMSFSFEVDGDAQTGSMILEDGCTVVTFESETVDSCDRVDDAQTEEIARLGNEVVEILQLSEVTKNAFGKLADVKTGLTVVERDGRWYLSLMPSMLELGNDYLAVLEPEDLVAMGTDIEELVDDEDRLASGFTALLEDADFEAIQGGQDGALAIEGLVDLLDSQASPQFVEVETTVSGSAGSFEPDDSYEFEDTPSIEQLEPKLLDTGVWTAVDAFNTYFAWEVGSAGEVGFVAGAYSFGGGVFIEVAEFSQPVDPALLDASRWAIEYGTDVATATSSDSGEQFTFVGNYVVWTGGDTDSMMVGAQQVALLR